jgi:hypothetical protein
MDEFDNKIAEIIELHLGRLTNGPRQAGQGTSMEREQRIHFTTREPVALGESMGVQYSIKSSSRGHFKITDVRPTHKATTTFTAKRLV